MRRMLLALACLGLLVSGAYAFEGAELYPGEKALYDQAAEEGMVVSFDTGPTWANWAKQFKGFKERYPKVEIVYNDLGSAATVVALDKARNRPQADTLLLRRLGLTRWPGRGGPLQAVTSRSCPSVPRKEGLGSPSTP